MKKYLKRKIYYIAKRIMFYFYEYGIDKEMDLSMDLLYKATRDYLMENYQPKKRRVNEYKK